MIVMKNLKVLRTIALLILIIVTYSCKKDTTPDPTPNPQLETGTVTDIDGNIYKTVKIGTQWWMAENLKTTKYRNGDAIDNITDNASWRSLTTGAYCWYNNDLANKAAYGALYNFYTIADSRNIAPTGWHVATDAEWTTLTTYLGGASLAGGKLKENGTTHWQSPNAGATNESGFTAMPGGCRFDSDGTFHYIGMGGNYYTGTEYNTADAWTRNLDLSKASCLSFHHVKQGGNSVRCVKD